MKLHATRLLQMIGRILGTTLMISFLILLVGFVYYWNSPVAFSDAFFTAGAILIILGIASITSRVSERMAAEITQRRYRIMILLTATGLLLIGIAVLIGRSLVTV